MYMYIPLYSFVINHTRPKGSKELWVFKAFTKIPLPKKLKLILVYND